MYCSKCNYWNEPGNIYCVSCGNRLPTPASETSQVLSEAQQLRKLICENYAVLFELDKRLEALEKGAKIPAADDAAPLAPPVRNVSPEKEIAAPPESTAGPVEQLLNNFLAPQPALKIERPQPPSPAVATPPAAEKPARPPGEWEQILGGNWLARIGVFALLIGVAFFLKYAFDKNWIVPVIRVLLGGALGLVLLGGGHLWRNKYPIMTRVLTGGGIGMMFLSVFAASFVYNLIPFVLVIILVPVICAISVFFALRYNSMALAILGVIGAFLAPLILGISGKGGGNSGVEIPVYLIIVDIGVLYLSTLRNWRWFTLLSFFSSVLIFLIAYGRYHIQIGLGVEETLATAFFLIFAGATVLFNTIRRKAADAVDYTLMTLNSAGYFGFSYSLMWSNLREWMGLFALILALFYGGLYYLIRQRGKENQTLSLFALSIGIIFLTIAIPVQIGDRAWTTIVWAVQGVVLVWLSFRTRMALLRFFSYPVFVLTAFRLIFFDTRISAAVFLPVFNQRGLAFLVCIAIIYLAGYILHHNKHRQSDSEKRERFVYPFFIIAANFLTMWFIGAELITFKHMATASLTSWPLLFLAALAGITTLQYLIWQRRLEIFDTGLLCIDAVFYLIMSIVMWGIFRGWMGSLYFLLAFVFFGLFMGVRRRSDRNKPFAITAVSLSIIYFTAAIPVQISNHFGVSIAWAGEFLLLVWIARAIRLAAPRYFAFGVFIITAGNLLILNTAVNISSFQVLLNLRVLAFAAGILAAYLGSFIIRSDKDILSEWNNLAAALVVAANFLTIWLLSFEIWNYFDTRALNGMAANAAQNAQNLSLTAIWLVYAVILLVVGIARRSRGVRLGGLVLIAISILKVFVWDVFALQTMYRIIAFVVLGVLLLVGGYLYQRYSARIKEFLTK